GIVLRHGLGDITRQLGHRALADQRARIVVVGPLPRCPVARGAHLAVDLLARPRLALILIVVGAGPDQERDHRQGQPARPLQRERGAGSIEAAVGTTDHGGGTARHAWATFSRGAWIASRSRWRRGRILY